MKVLLVQVKGKLGDNKRNYVNKLVFKNEKGIDKYIHVL